VLSVGLAPGLTNLLARRCAQVLNDVRSLDVFVMLGLGEAHGMGAIRWTVENLDKRFEGPGVPETVGSFEDPKTTLFPGGYGRRKAYRFDFADLHVIARTLCVERVATRLCFDSAALTRLLALKKRTGAFHALRYRRVRDILVGFLSRFRPGSDGFAGKVEAEGLIGGRPELYSCSIWGYGEGRTTGIVAALVAERLCASPSGPGVFHIEQLFEPVELFSRVEDLGFMVDLQDGRFK
jgi:saccharopine dehydrogenase (NAD+, L-lysine-forming)